LIELEDIQQDVVARLSGFADFNGAVVVADDGNYPKTPGIEKGLSTVGLVLIAWQIDCIGADAGNITSNGFVAYNVAVDIVIEENQAVCRVAAGANVAFLKAVRLVIARLSGSGPGGCGGQNPYLPATQVFKNLGKSQGINRAVVSFTKLIITKPDLSP